MGDYLGGVGIGFILGMIFFGFLLNVSNDTYKDGQIDAINGKIHYELVEQPNGTTEWEFKE